MEFLAFHPRHADFAGRLARAVADHATPVGSGTVARTKRIPVEQRAEAAVIAWMRHQTTAYDSMKIPRIKGKRREIGRMLAQRSQELLARYRRGEPVGEDCPLKKALMDAASVRSLSHRRCGADGRVRGRAVRPLSRRAAARQIPRVEGASVPATGRWSPPPLFEESCGLAAVMCWPGRSLAATSPTPVSMGAVVGSVLCRACRLRSPAGPQPVQGPHRRSATIVRRPQPSASRVVRIGCQVGRPRTEAWAEPSLLPERFGIGTRIPMRKATRVPASSPARPCWQTHYPAGRVLIEGEVRVIEPQPILAGPAEIMERINTLHAECEALGWWEDGNDDACDERVDE